MFIVLSNNNVTNKQIWPVHKPMIWYINVFYHACHLLSMSVAVLYILLAYSPSCDRIYGYVQVSIDILSKSEFIVFL